MGRSRVLVIGDTHCPGMLPNYPQFLQRTYKKYNCNCVVHIGDLVDLAAISYHAKSPGLSSVEEEFDKARKQVARLYRLFPTLHWIIGNHDALTERQAASAGLPPEVLRDYSDIWQVPNWTVHPRYARHIIDDTVYTHGDAGKSGMHAAVKNSRDNFCNWVQGHCHSEGGVWWTTVEQRSVFGMNVGCGVDRDLLQFEYAVKFNRKPCLGCGVVINGKQAIYEPMI